MPQMQSTRATQVFLHGHNGWPRQAELQSRRVIVVPGASLEAEAAAPEEA